MTEASRRGRVIDAMQVLLDGDGPSFFVAGGARISGGRGDALIRIDVAEHARRQRCGSGAITELWQLDVLMNLPYGQPVPISALDDAERWALDRMPDGAVRREHDWVVRTCAPVAQIVAVVVWGRQLETLLKRVAPFTSVAPCAVVLDPVPRNFDVIAWQASFQGTGVWTASEVGAREHLPAGPVRIRHRTAARWHIEEYAYAQWVTTQRALAPSSSADHVGSALRASDRDGHGPATDPTLDSSRQLRSAPR